MHFSIPEAEDFRDETGNLYTLYTIAINGANHCSVRFSQLNNLNEQLVTEFGAQDIPNFPGKKLFALSETGKDERKFQLENYFQKLSQTPDILNSAIINSFFAEAQKETAKEPETKVDVSLYLTNFEKINITVNSYDQTEDILQKFMEEIGLDIDFIYYFGIYLVKKDEHGGIEIVRQLQDFESPCLSLKVANKTEKHKLLLRKATFDSSFDDKLYDDKMALNLLFIQAVAELDWGWIKPSTDMINEELEELKEAKSKKKFLEIIKQQKFYGYIHLKPCLADFPEKNTKAHISVGNNHVYYLYSDVNNKNKQLSMSLKVTRIRCWKITSVKNESNKISLEFSFEYLLKKDTFQWVTLKSNQSILLSMCLQSMIDEIVMKKQRKSISDGRHKTEQLPFLTRNKAIIHNKASKRPAKSEKNGDTAPNINEGENSLFEDDNFISNDDL